MKTADEIAEKMVRDISDTLTNALWNPDTKADTAPTFMSQCMHRGIKEKGRDPKQAIAICLSLSKKWGDTAADWDSYMASRKSEDEF